MLLEENKNLLEVFGKTVKKPSIKMSCWMLECTIGIYSKNLIILIIIRVRHIIYYKNSSKMCHHSSSSFEGYIS